MEHSYGDKARGVAWGRTIQIRGKKTSKSRARLVSKTLVDLDRADPLKNKTKKQYGNIRKEKRSVRIAYKHA